MRANEGLLKETLIGSVLGSAAADDMGETWSSGIPRASNSELTIMVRISLGRYGFGWKSGAEVESRVSAVKSGALGEISWQRMPPTSTAFPSFYHSIFY
jgi:hypothetical protein